MKKSLLILYAIILWEQFIHGEGTDTIRHQLSGASSSGSDVNGNFPKADLNRDINPSAGEFNMNEYRASWCVPCRMMASFFTDIKEYMGDDILKGDIDQCKEGEQSQGLASMPTFTLYHKLPLEQLAGLTTEEKPFRSKIDEIGDPRYKNLAYFVNKCQCTYLNAMLCHSQESSDESVMNPYLNPQLIISIFFSQPVNVHALMIKGPAWNGPKTIKLFTNLPNILNSKNVENDEATQKVELNSKNLDGEPINLISDKFQKVDNLQIFVEENQEKDDSLTIINDMVILGNLA